MPSNGQNDKDGLTPTISKPTSTKKTFVLAVVWILSLALVLAVAIPLCKDSEDVISQESDSLLNDDSSPTESPTALASPNNQQCRVL